MKKSIIISAIIVLFLLGIVIGAILIKNSAESKEEKLYSLNHFLEKFKEQ